MIQISGLDRWFGVNGRKWWLHDPPTVTATAPTGTVSSGGPYLSTAWTYSQAQGDAQEWFRVQIVNDADTEIYHDSGWLAGADATRDIDVGDPPGVPGDSSDVSTKVYVRGPVTTGIGRFEAESDLLPFIVALGDPHLTIVAPNPTPPESATPSTAHSRRQR